MCILQIPLGNWACRVIFCHELPQMILPPVRLVGAPCQKGYIIDVRRKAWAEGGATGGTANAGEGPETVSPPMNGHLHVMIAWVEQEKAVPGVCHIPYILNTGIGGNTVGNQLEEGRVDPPNPRRGVHEDTRSTAMKEGAEIKPNRQGVETREIRYRGLGEEWLSLAVVDRTKNPHI
ncbi:hypothetical protein ASPBRDRAFT_302098 [Aspergillus brasiliensis CBS 101740]|uniref:Uncharacterized protein n=1 Tax=Aspergillus brasiliensis (strain CBS 101740 / IMI 381727 / IBT 21946) TaxID=767769 RepID=A0A1L9U9T9_ASPBC|nr:hypothetical protein ASPBRDRAFT_302098 [Aspergillus brasiliensis CBS 101740]